MTSCSTGTQTPYVWAGTHNTPTLGPARSLARCSSVSCSFTQQQQQQIAYTPQQGHRIWVPPSRSIYGEARRHPRLTYPFVAGCDLLARKPGSPAVLAHLAAVGALALVGDESAHTATRTHSEGGRSVRSRMERTVCLLHHAQPSTDAPSLGGSLTACGRPLWKTGGPTGGACAASTVRARKVSGLSGRSSVGSPATHALTTP
jgi:hypothetical protein